MNRMLALGMAFTAGILMSIQPAVNAALGQRTGVFEGALISFLVGGIGLCVLVAAAGKGDLKAIRGTPAYLLTGGLMGVVAVTTMIVVIPQVGSGVGMITILTGQMLMATLIDANGWLGVNKIPIRPNRIVGLILLFISMSLMVGSI